MADYDPGIALKVGNQDNNDLTDKLARIAQVKSAMDAAASRNSKPQTQGAFQQGQGAFQQGQGAYGDPTSPAEGWSLGKALNDFIGSKPAY
jgi:hypothetical protein